MVGTFTNMIGPEFVNVRNGDIDINVATVGTGPLILCIHGWPELWYSWRHQLAHFAERGFTVAAMDVRGYGGSSKPTEIEAYSLRHLCADAAAVIDELGNGSAIVLGHDWGAPIAYNTARLHADRVIAVAGLSVPYSPISETDPLEMWKQIYADRFFYQTYIAGVPGVAEAEMAADSARALRLIYYAACGSADRSLFEDKPPGAGLLDGLIDPDPLPAWLGEDDLGRYAEAFDAGGWHGPFHRYRAQPIDAREIGPLPDPNLHQPATFIGGELDGVRNFVPGIDLYDYAGNAIDDLRGTTIIAGAGHWVQQEAPEATNAALDAFIATLG
jgi:pimeloyl-ACP methyl ester carboxylesterase